MSFQINEWSLKIRKEMRVIDRQIRGELLEITVFMLDDTLTFLTVTSKQNDHSVCQYIVIVCAKMLYFSYIE